MMAGRMKAEMQAPDAAAHQGRLAGRPAKNRWPQGVGVSDRTYMGGQRLAHHLLPSTRGPGAESWWKIWAPREQGQGLLDGPV